MSRFLPALLLAALSGFTVAAAIAQAAPPDAASSAPLGAYRPFTEEEVLPWKDSNDNVGRIGGWRAYAREAQGAASAPRSAASARDPHGGHKH